MTDCAARATALKPSLSGRLFYHLLPARRRTVLDNMSIVFGETLTGPERQRLAQCFYGHLMRTARENFSMTFMTDRKLASLVDVEGVEHPLAAAEKGKGVLMLSGHFGNWEMAAVASFLKFQEFRNRLHVIRKRLFGPLEWIMPGRFRKFGFGVIPLEGALGTALDALERNDALIFIMDQHASRRGKALGLDFFGSLAWTQGSLALLAGHTGAPVIPAVCYRTAAGRHVLRFEPEIPWIAADSPDEELRLNTIEYNKVLERFVLEHPEQWFWMHRRWKPTYAP